MKRKYTGTPGEKAPLFGLFVVCFEKPTLSVCQWNKIIINNNNNNNIVINLNGMPFFFLMHTQDEQNP